MYVFVRNILGKYLTCTLSVLNVKCSHTELSQLCPGLTWLLVGRKIPEWSHSGSRLHSVIATYHTLETLQEFCVSFLSEAIARDMCVLCGVKPW